jgi:DNA-binding NarL/FixJ family response regulator
LRVVVVEDEPLFRELLCTGLRAATSSVEVVASFESAQAAMAASDCWPVDVLLTDIDLGSGDDGVALGLNAATSRRVRGVVLLSNFAMPAILADAPTTSTVGWGYLLKTSVSNIHQVHRALQGASQGELVIDQALTSELSPVDSSPLATLSARQLEVLALMANGWSNQVIAERLFISVRTVESTISTIIRNLGLEPQTKQINARAACVALFLRDTIRHRSSAPARTQSAGSDIGTAS